MKPRYRYNRDSGEWERVYSFDFDRSEASAIRTRMTAQGSEQYVFVDPLEDHISPFWRFMRKLGGLTK